jgi:hypothetical protein
MWRPNIAIQQQTIAQHILSAFLTPDAKSQDITITTHSLMILEFLKASVLGRGGPSTLADMQHAKCPILVQETRIMCNTHRHTAACRRMRVVQTMGIFLLLMDISTPHSIGLNTGFLPEVANKIRAN